AKYPLVVASHRSRAASVRNAACAFLSPSRSATFSQPMADSRETSTGSPILTLTPLTKARALAWMFQRVERPSRRNRHGPNNAERVGFRPAVAGPQHLRAGFLYMIPVA